MKDFFTFYTDIKDMAVPFTAFSLYHMLFLALAILLIALLFSHYRHLDARKQRRMQVMMATYFLVEELLYTTWLFLFCHDQVWHQILPLELCSLCVYMNALTVYLKKDTLRFFSGVVGLCAGLIAMVYPANISELYPVLSYRTINFYILHAAFVLFALIQLQDRTLLQYHYMKKNFLIICGMFTTAFIINLNLHTQYMFVGIPPKISFIASLYHVTGIMMFLPAVLLALFLIQCAVVFILRRVYRVKQDMRRTV